MSETIFPRETPRVYTKESPITLTTAVGVMCALSNLPGKGSCLSVSESLSETSERTEDSCTPFPMFCTEHQGVSLDSSHSHRALVVTSAGSNFTRQGSPQGPRDLMETRSGQLQCISRMPGPWTRRLSLAPQDQHTYGLSNRWVRSMVKTSCLSGFAGLVILIIYYLAV